MLEKPNLPDEKIVACLRDEYGLGVLEINFLALGADKDTAVYRGDADDGTPYFIKLRRGGFDETSVALPSFLHAQGIAQIIAPVPTKTGELSAALEAFKLIVCPFIHGHNAYEGEMTAQHWGEFGAALKRIHTLQLPLALAQRIRREAFSPEGREMVLAFLQRLDEDAGGDVLAQKTATFLKTKCAELVALVKGTEQLARQLQAQSMEFVLCHSDLHAGNIFIGARGALYIVDWDNPIVAPKERDLMYAGGGQFGGARTPQQEEILFYAGYGQTELDRVALAYYRYERIIEDIAVECAQIFSPHIGILDREQEFEYMQSNFLPNGVLELARASDKMYGL